MSEVKINPLQLAIRYGFTGTTEDGYYISNGMHASWQAIQNMAFDRAMVQDENAELRMKFFSQDETIRTQQATIDMLTEQNASQQVFCANYEATQFELVQAAKEVIRISDRNHEAWNKLKALIAEIEATNEKSINEQ